MSTGETFVPPAFAARTPQQCRDFIARYPFAQLVTSDLSVTHLPLALVGDQLRGHASKANPHWRQIDAEDGSLACVAIFNGPHAYISPKWYAADEAVPTWNYATVHVRGSAHVHTDPAWLATELERALATFERPPSDKVTPAIRAKLSTHIVGISINIESITGKFKLSQNRPAADRARVIAALKQGDHMDQDLARYMLDAGYDDND